MTNQGVHNHWRFTDDFNFWHTWNRVYCSHY